MTASPPPRSRTGMIALLCVAQFVVVLDATIVAIALPAIQRSLHVATGDLQWVVSAYTLAFAGFLVLAGRLADLHGRRRVFMAGLALFAGASLACGLSRSPGMLVAARALQGLGAAAVAPAALAAITAAVPDGPERRRALGVWTAAAAGGGASGWLLGGVITEQAGWPWVFLVNVPIGAAAVALAPLLVPETRAGGAGRRLDVAGRRDADDRPRPRRPRPHPGADRRRPLPACGRRPRRGRPPARRVRAHRGARGRPAAAGVAAARRRPRRGQPRRRRADGLDDPAAAALRARAAGRPGPLRARDRRAVRAVQPRGHLGLAPRPARGARPRDADGDGARAGRHRGRRAGDARVRRCARGPGRRSSPRSCSWA